MDGLSQMRKGVFITGTDTDVGKTMVSCALLEFFHAAGAPLMGVKPVCCGGREDVEFLQSQNTRRGFHYSDDQINPVYLSEPAAPISLTGAVPELSSVVESLSTLSDTPLLIEGAGGWAVPVTPTWNMEELAVAFQAPVILVISNKLGALNHSILTANAIKAAGLPLIGYILNTVSETEYTHAQETNREVLDQVLSCPCLADIPLGGGECSSEPLRLALKMSNLDDLPLQFQISNS